MNVNLGLHGGFNAVASALAGIITVLTVRAQEMASLVETAKEAEIAKTHKDIFFPRGKTGRLIIPNRKLVN